MSKLSSSPQRNTFQANNYLRRRAEEGKTPNNDPTVGAMMDYYKKWNVEKLEKEQDPEWQKNNLEYDLRATEWICTKAKTREEYAQNLYAALCNNEFQKNEVWPLLKGETWSCTWRYAGGILSDMIEKGDYIDWYCSGIISSAEDEEYASMSKEDQERYLFTINNFVGEGCITEEIREDLFKLGWTALDNDSKE